MSAQKLGRLQPFVGVSPRDVWADLHLLGQPITFLAGVRQKGVGSGSVPRQERAAEEGSRGQREAVLLERAAGGPTELPGTKRTMSAEATELWEFLEKHSLQQYYAGIVDRLGGTGLEQGC